MTPAQRFVTKLARALILKRPRLVIDRPGAMLYDVPYPPSSGNWRRRPR